MLLQYISRSFNISMGFCFFVKRMSRHFTERVGVLKRISRHFTERVIVPKINFVMRFTWFIRTCVR